MRFEISYKNIFVFLNNVNFINLSLILINIKEFLY